MLESLSAKSVRKPLWARLARGLGLSAWVVTGLLGISSLLLIVFVMAMPTEAAKYLTTATIGQLLLNAFLYLIAVLVVIGVPYWFVRYVLRKPQEEGITKRVLGIDKPFRVRNIGLLALCFFGYFAATIVFSALATLLPWFDVNQAQDVGFKNLSTTFDLVLAFVALVVLPPIAEELLFRGYLFGRLRQENGFWFSAIITSLLFGLVHLQWNVGVDTFVLSIFLCILREKTGSIWTSMMLHGLKNGVAYFFLFIAPLLGLNLLQ